MKIVNGKAAAAKLGVSYSFVMALKKAAKIKSRLFDLNCLTRWWKKHPDFKKADAYKKSNNGFQVAG